jgi:hypothetical protein
MLNEVSENSKMSSQDLQVALATVDLEVHESTIRNKLHKFDLYGRCVRKKPLPSKKTSRQVSQRTPRKRPGLLEQCLTD